MKMCRENSKLDIDACCVLQAVLIFIAYFNAGWRSDYQQRYRIPKKCWLCETLTSFFFKDFTPQTSILMLKNSQEAPNDHQRRRKTNGLFILYVGFLRIIFGLVYTYLD